MEVIRGLHNLRERHRGCVLSIGNFDGFHRGHQAIVARLCEQADRASLPAVVQVFEPTPREVLTPDAAPPRIATGRGKWRQLQRAGVDRVLCVRFDRQFAANPAEKFAREVLSGRLGVRAVVVGEGFRFGAGRGGDVSLLARLGSELGFIAEAVPAVEVGGTRASSTALREALATPDLERAERILGRPYSIIGRVRRGRQLGRTLAMPTANIPLRRPVALRDGVYAVRVAGGTDRWDGVANLGLRPTVDGRARVLESHLFAAPGDLYGRELEVQFASFLRGEQRFESVDDLARQMQADGAEARRRLGR